MVASGPKKILVAGCGFLGETAANFFLRGGWGVIALTHSPESALALRGRGIDAFACDISSEQSLRKFRSHLERGADACGAHFGCWLHCASSGRGAADAYRKVYLDGARNLLSVFPEAHGVFTSSTSVYAQTDGSDAHEESETRPERETGKILLEAEAAVLRAGGSVARLAGIYGPGRSVLLRKFLDGTARIEKGGSRWINQIHVRDGASALHFIAERRLRGEIYNVCDDRPMRQIELYSEMARRLASGLPPHGEPDLGRKRGWTNKRVLNAKLKKAGWAPHFPCYFDAWEELLAPRPAFC